MAGNRLGSLAALVSDVVVSAGLSANYMGDLMTLTHQRGILHGHLR